MNSTKIAAATLTISVIGACAASTTQPSDAGTSSSASSSGASSTSSSGSSSSSGGSGSSTSSSASSSSGGSPGGGDDARAPTDDGSGGEAGAVGTDQADASTDGQTETSTGVGVIDELYEAEAIPPNQMFGFAQKALCTPKCATPLTVGANCCSGTGQVTWIVSANGAHPAGWMQFNAISAPANASYDVTIWYHCGLSDTYGDNNCGGQAMTEPKQTGCRPHVFTVNGTVMPGAYHLPCFPGSWATIYAATVSLPLTAGMNTIKVAAPPPRDAVDVDAIEIRPPGKGHAPLIAVNTTDLLGK